MIPRKPRETTCALCGHHGPCHAGFYAYGPDSDHIAGMSLEPICETCIKRARLTRIFLSVVLLAVALACVVAFFALTGGQEAYAASDAERVAQNEQDANRVGVVVVGVLSLLGSIAFLGSALVDLADSLAIRLRRTKDTVYWTRTGLAGLRTVLGGSYPSFDADRYIDEFYRNA